MRIYPNAENYWKFRASFLIADVIAKYEYTTTRLWLSLVESSRIPEIRDHPGSIVIATREWRNRQIRSKRGDLRPKFGDSLKVNTIKYFCAAAIKAVCHATVSRLLETVCLASSPLSLCLSTCLVKRDANYLILDTPVVWVTKITTSRLSTP